MMIMHLAYDSFIVELTNNVSLLLPVDYIKQISQYDQKIYDDHKHIIMLIAYISQPKKKTIHLKKYQRALTDRDNYQLSRSSCC